MFSLEPTSYDRLLPERKAYLENTTAPLDGMWEDAFFPAADHLSICQNGTTIGYCAKNADGAMLGFHVDAPNLKLLAFRHCLRALEITNAFVSTAEPCYLSLCLDQEPSVTVNAVMYEDNLDNTEPGNFPDGMSFRRIDRAEHHIAVQFGVDAIQADPNWLANYYSERIDKNELFGIWKGADLVTAGELRLSASQKHVADVGMIVASAYRKQGLATLILKRLRYDGRKAGLRLICSTERDNTGAQKAISRAGFTSNHRILNVGFGSI